MIDVKLTNGQAMALYDLLFSMSLQGDESNFSELPGLWGTVRDALLASLGSINHSTFMDRFNAWEAQQRELLEERNRQAPAEDSVVFRPNTDNESADLQPPRPTCDGSGSGWTLGQPEVIDDVEVKVDQDIAGLKAAMSWIGR